MRATDMPAVLALADFAPLVGAGFTLHSFSGDTLPLTLVEAQPLTEHPGAPRPPFALLFQGPAAPLLPQAVYAVAHPALGAGPLEIFLVPVAGGPAGIRYEAVFN